MDPNHSGNKGLTIICITNLPGQIDSAFTSRCTAQFAFELPNAQEREALLWKFLNNLNHSYLPEHIKYCAQLCDGFSGRDISHVIDKCKNWPTHKLLTAKHFSRVPNLYYCLKENCDRYHPCNENYVGAEEIDVRNIKDYICQPMMTVADLIFEIRSTACTATQSDLEHIKKYEQQLRLNIHYRQSNMPAAPVAVQNLEKLEFLWKMNSIMIFTSHQSKFKKSIKKFKYKIFKTPSAGLAKTIIEKEAKNGCPLALLIVRCTDDFEKTEQYFHSETEYLTCQLEIEDYIERICKDKLNSFDVEF